MGEQAETLWLPVPEDLLAVRAGDVSQRNAKAVEAQYDAGRRASDVRVIKAHCGSQIVAARRWFDRMVMPAMRVEALRKA